MTNELINVSSPPVHSESNSWGFQSLAEFLREAKWEGHDSPECFKWRAKHEPIAFIGSWANHEAFSKTHCSCGPSKNCAAAHITLHCHTMPRFQVSVCVCELSPRRCVKVLHFASTMSEWPDACNTSQMNPKSLYSSEGSLRTSSLHHLTSSYYCSRSVAVSDMRIKWYQTYSSGRMMKGPKQTPMFWHRVSRQWGKFADRDKRMSYHTAVCACVGVCVCDCVCLWLVRRGLWGRWKIQTVRRVVRTYI